MAKKQPAQHQDRQPGLQSKMTPKPVSDRREHQGTGKLRDKVALITGARRTSASAKKER